MNTQDVIQTFMEHIGATPTLLVRSPGRVNLIGDHTDYNEGWAFPAALNLTTQIAARPRVDGVLHTVALRMPETTDSASLNNLSPHGGPPWARYVRGVVALLQEAGYPLVGADLVITGDLPLGSGLSSSAALEMGVAVALLTLIGGDSEQNEQKALARLGQRVENEIIGLQSGIMDQLAILYGLPNYALLLDCRTLDTTPVPIPPEVRILVIDSAVPRTLAGSGYNQRRSECTAALEKLRILQPDLRALRDVTPALLAQAIRLLSPVEVRRVRHVISENQRVLDSVAALQQGDAITFGQLMVASHHSLRHDYEVSIAPIDQLVDLALETPGVLGARITGGGFGGCVVALVETPHAEEAAASITTRYRQTTGQAGIVYICTPAAGTHVVPLAEGM